MRVKTTTILEAIKGFVFRCPHCRKPHPLSDKEWFQIDRHFGGFFREKIKQEKRTINELSDAVHKAKTELNWIKKNKLV